MQKLRLVLLIMLLLSITLTAQAQTATPSATPTNPNATITWPPPVYAVQGQFQIRGSANLPNMVSYFIEYRPLNADLSLPAENAPWFPATLPSRAPVLDNVLGVWDTTTEQDGLYQLRMTINVQGGTPVYVLVSPLRILNELPPFVQPIATQPPVALPTLQAATPQIQPTTPLLPTPTQFDPTPRAIATTNGNVRRGDSTVYEVISSLTVNQEVPIVALSATGSGWYQIQLPNGARGWVAPSVVQVTGDLSGLPRIVPPPPPSPTPIPATATPITQANLIVQSISFTPDPPVCKGTFTITARILNNGTGPTSASASISIQDIHVASGTVTQTTIGGVPVLSAGQSFDALIPITVSTFFEEGHRVNIAVDSLNQVPELNEFDNGASKDYTLGKGTC